MKSTRRGVFVSLIGLPLALAAAQAFAAPSSPAFDKVVNSVRAEALARGVSQRTINRALTGVEPLTIEHLENNQPERSRTVTFAEYYGRHVTPASMTRARQFRQTHARVLEKAERDTGVPASVILSILNIESRFGNNTGNQKVIPALLTLVRDVKGDDKRARDRRAMFHEEAVQALMLIDEGYEEILTKDGSWAGAVGPGQFMPSSIRRYAVDGDGDGKKNMWSDYDDVIPSIANYLKEKGWQAGQDWGDKVDLPQGFDKNLLTDTLLHQTNKTASEWSALGVKRANGQRLSADGQAGMMIAPNYNVQNGVLKGPAYLVHENFRTVMQYNKSYKYALTVLQMSDALDARRPAPAITMPAPDPYNQ